MPSPVVTYLSPFEPPTAGTGPGGRIACGFGPASLSVSRLRGALGALDAPASQATGGSRVVGEPQPAFSAASPSVSASAIRFT